MRPARSSTGPAPSAGPLPACLLAAVLALGAVAWPVGAAATPAPGVPGPGPSAAPVEPAPAVTPAPTDGAGPGGAATTGSTPGSGATGPGADPRDTVSPGAATAPPVPTAVTTAGPGDDGTPAPTPAPTPEVTAGATGTASPAPAPRPATAPAVVRTTIPLGSVLLSLAVLLGAALLVRGLLRRLPERAPSASPVGAGPVAASVADGAAVGDGAADRDGPTVDGDVLELLVTLGTALVDAGDAIHHVQEALEQVAAAHGADGVGIVVMPTALFVSVPGETGVRTEVTPAGTSPMRLGQVEEVYRVLDDVRERRLSPTAAVVALERARLEPPHFGVALQLAGYVLFTVGLVLILRGGWLELGLGAVVGLVVGAMQLAVDRGRPQLQPLLPVAAAFAASLLVLTAGRLEPGLGVFPPLVASLVAFLPGALLTTAVFELSTGQIVSGAGRLAAGFLRLVLLAVGILSAAALVGVPAATVSDTPTGAVSVLVPWLGVVVFATGVVLFRGARWSSLPWILLVVLVAYAGQVVGGALLGPSLSAFAGALVMTPAAMVVARQPTGPPAIVSFLPGFWLLVPGAVGLEGVTRFLGQETVEGVASLVTMGTSMVGIALGVLLGLVLGGEVARRFARHRGPAPEGTGPR